MRVLFTGGRNFLGWQLFNSVVDAIHVKINIDYVIEGGASGADTLARNWRINNNIDGVTCPADWDNIEHPDAVPKLGKSGKWYDANAGFRRNAEMLAKHRPEMCIGFVAGPGTRDMMERAMAAGVPTLYVPDPLSNLFLDDDGIPMESKPEWLLKPDPNGRKIPRQAPKTPSGLYAGEF